MTNLDAHSTLTVGQPTQPNVIVRQNQYDPTRAHIIVYNWDGRSSVEANLSSVLKVGDRYEIRNAQNYFAAPVLAGTYDGNAVRLPMTGLAVAAPVGLKSPAPTGPQFNVFVLIKR